MKTIEEKIKEFARKLTPCGICLTEYEYMGCGVEIEDCAWYKAIYNALTEVAKLQQEIDTNKSFEIYEKELRKMKRSLNASGGGAGKLISVGKALSEFRIAMEEEL